MEPSELKESLLHVPNATCFDSSSASYEICGNVRRVTVSGEWAFIFVDAGFPIALMTKSVPSLRPHTSLRARGRLNATIYRVFWPDHVPLTPIWARILGTEGNPDEDPEILLRLRLLRRALTLEL